MALQQTIKAFDQFNEEVEYVDAYIRVHAFEGTKETVKVSVDYYRKQGDASPIMVKGFAFPMNLNGGNVVAQAYLHLKSLPEFSGAQDV